MKIFLANQLHITLTVLYQCLQLHTYDTIILLAILLFVMRVIMYVYQYNAYTFFSLFTPHLAILITFCIIMLFAINV